MYQSPKKNHGFTLIEIMIVIAIIVIILSIAIPNLLRSRANSNEAAAVRNLRTVMDAQAAYRATHFSYANFAELTEAEPPYLDDGWSQRVVKQGYQYILDPFWHRRDFQAYANRQSENTGSRNFYVNASGNILYQRDIDGNVDPEEGVRLDERESAE